MPFVGYFSGRLDFADMKMVLDEAIVTPDGSMSKPENAIINLIIVGFVLFMIVKTYNKTPANC